LVLLSLPGKEWWKMNYFDREPLTLATHSIVISLVVSSTGYGQYKYGV